MRNFLIRLLLGLALAKYACQAASFDAQVDLLADDCTPGEFGSDLGLLRKSYTPPQTVGESNHYIELWSGPKIRQKISAAGLTNNRALFVNSHGKGILRGTVTRHAFYPHESLLRTNQPTPYFSAADLACVVGAEQAEKIHNVLIAGCNSEGSFDPAEVRKYFVNATNITYMVAGELGYQPMFLQAALSHSSKISPLYEKARTNNLGKLEYHLGHKPSQGATRFNPYVAALFQADGTKPFSIQIAGRELLELTSAPVALSVSSETAMISAQGKSLRRNRPTPARHFSR